MEKTGRPRSINDDEWFDSIGIRDDKMFKDVFGGDAELAGQLLECVLGHPVGTVEYVEASRETRPEWDARATTFDVYLRTERGMLGELEMQHGKKREIPLRLRTHLSKMDRDAVGRGVDFVDAQESVSVFICTFDPLDAGLRRYTIRRYVEETGETFPDRQLGVLLNTRGSGDEIPGRLGRFLRYVEGYDGDDVMDDDFVRDVDRHVRKNREDARWRRGYMTLQEKLDDARAEGYELGVAQGIERGLKQGIEQGIERGIERGREEGLAELARLLDAEGLEAVGRRLGELACGGSGGSATA